MKFLIMIVVGLVLLHGSLADRKHNLRKNKGILSGYGYLPQHHRAGAVHQRERSATCRYPGTSGCKSATDQLSNKTVENCMDIFNHIFDGTGVTDADVQTYCATDDCGGIVRSVFDDISACCGDSVLPDGIIATLDDSCKMNKDHVYCLKVDADLQLMFTNPTSDKGGQFITCGSTYNSDTSTCPSECKSILDYIINTAGCCYAGIASTPGPASQLAPDGLFTVCGYTAPRRCAGR